MPFGMVSGVGRGMGVLDGTGDRRKGSCSLRVKVVTNGDFGVATWLFPNYSGISCIVYYIHSKHMLCYII